MISEERTIMEAHQRYIAVRNGMYEYYEKELCKAFAERDKAEAKAKDAEARLAEALEEIKRLKGD